MKSTLDILAEKETKVVSLWMKVDFGLADVVESSLSMFVWTAGSYSSVTSGGPFLS